MLTVVMEIERLKFEVTVTPDTPQLMSASESVGVAEVFPSQIAALPSLGEKEIFPESL